MNKEDKIFICGSGGFIGGHLVADVRQDSTNLKAVDLKPLNQWYQRFPDVEYLSLGFRRTEIEAGNIPALGGRTTVAPWVAGKTF